MTILKQVSRFLGLALLPVSQVWAFSFDIGDFEGSIDTSMSVGASMRMQANDTRLVGKTNIEGQETLCQPKVADPAGLCVFSGFGDLVAADGQFGTEADQSRLNYDKYDVHTSAFRINSAFSMAWENFSIYARGYAFYDPVNDGWETRNVNTINQPARQSRNAAQDDLLAFNAKILDAYVSGDFEFGDYILTLRLGKQLVSWGESLLLPVRSLNTINVPNLARFFLPGADLTEIFDPVEMAYATMNLTDNITAEAFYQLKWRPLELPPKGYFFSPTDAVDAGAYSGLLALGRGAEDPDNLADDQFNGGTEYGPEGPPGFGRGCLNPDSPVASTYDNPQTSVDESTLGNGHRDGALGRTTCRYPNIEPRDGGQYGIGVKWFAEAINDTEFGFYYANYHARIPMVSVYPAVNAAASPGAVAGVITDLLGNVDPIDFITNAPEFAGAVADVASVFLNDPSAIPNAVQIITDILGGLGIADTLSYALDYPEDIKMYGISFNTNIGDWSVAGEYVWRPNVPYLIDDVEIVAYALSPALNTSREFSIVSQLEDYRYGGLPAHEAGAFADERDRADQDGDGIDEAVGIIRGYERLHVGQGDLFFLKVISTNPFGADQIILGTEFGFTKVFGMPGKNELAFEAPGTYTKIDQGRLDAQDGNGNDQDGSTLLLNPVNTDESLFADSFSWGVRVLSIWNYNQLFAGFNVNPLFVIGWDINGNSPGPGGHFVEGRKQFIAALAFERGPLTIQPSYLWYTGAGIGNLDRDKDSASLAIKWKF